MLWVRAFHIFFVVCWFAGIFYLPRLLVNHVTTEDPAVRERLEIMERKLYRFITPFAVLTVVFGVWLLTANWNYYLNAAWMWLKLALVAVLLVYHGFCGYYVGRLRDNKPVPGHVYFRVFNEFPVLLLLAIVILVEVRPF